MNHHQGIHALLISFSLTRTEREGGRSLGVCLFPVTVCALGFPPGAALGLIRLLLLFSAGPSTSVPPGCSTVNGSQQRLQQLQIYVASPSLHHHFTITSPSLLHRHYRGSTFGMSVCVEVSMVRYIDRQAEYQNI